MTIPDCVRPSEHVSIVMPAFNAARFVEEAARSVLAQDWPSLELIAIDDGSTDGTAERLSAIAGAPLPAGRTMRVFRQQNLGAAAARNAGLRLADGDFVAFIDADDRWHPALLSSLLGTLRDDDSVDLVFPVFRYIDEAGVELGIQSNVTSARFDAADLLVANPIHSATGVVVRRRAIEAAGAFDESLSSCIDLDYFIRIGLSRRGNIALTPAVLADYRRRAGQITGDWRKMHSNWSRVLEKSLAQGLELPPARLREARGRWLLYCATIAYNAGDYHAARSLMAGVWRSNPALALRNRHAQIRTLACLTTLLPKPLHDRLRADVNAARRRLGLDWS